MISVQRFSSDKSKDWELFLGQASNSMLYHSLNFLNYHGERFKKNEHHLIYYKGDKIIALMPLGEFTENEEINVRSPYGASIGGIVHMKNLQLKSAQSIIEELLSYSKSQQWKKITVTLPSYIYSLHHNAAIEFSLINHGFQLSNRDVLHYVELPADTENLPSFFDSKCRNQMKKALEKYRIVEDASAEDFYPILLEDKNRHEAKATHSLTDLIYLKKTFPDRIHFDLATDENGFKAGICYFKVTDHCVSTFYMAQMTAAIGSNPLNALIYKGIERSINEGIKFFDFGGSSVNSKIQNIGVANFKESFNAVSAYRDTYTINI